MRLDVDDDGTAFAREFAGEPDQSGCRHTIVGKRSGDDAHPPSLFAQPQLPSVLLDEFLRLFRLACEQQSFGLGRDPMYEFLLGGMFGFLFSLWYGGSCGRHTRCRGRTTKSLERFEYLPRPRRRWRRRVRLRLDVTAREQF